MRHVVLTIGYQHFWLPDDSGVATLLKTLSKATQIERVGFGDKRLTPISDDEFGAGEVSMQYTALKPAVPKPEPPPKPKLIAAERKQRQRQLLLEHKP